jgi:hypothetical protein
MKTERRGVLLGKQTPRRRGLVSENDTPFSEQVHLRYPEAARAYRVSIYGLIPPLSLILGPLAVVLGLRARRRARRDPNFTGDMLARAAIVLGALLTITSWAGLVLMILGLRQS